jgi:hypothetical protein
MGVRVLQPKLAYCTARFGRSNFGQQMPPAPTDAFRTPAADVGTYGRGRTGKFCLNAHFHGAFRDLLHAANLRYGTHGFTSLPKEGVLRIFPPLKIRRFCPGLKPRTWVPEASTLTPRPPKPLCV